MLCEMLTGDAPFHSADGTIEGLFKSIAACEVHIHTLPVLPVARNLIAGLLQKDASKRLKAADCKCHEFFADLDWARLYHKQLVPPFQPTIEEEELEGHDPSPRKKAICNVM